MWNWRIVAYAGILCVFLSCCGMAGGLLGQRGWLYLAFGGAVGLVVTIIAVTIDWSERRRR